MRKGDGKSSVTFDIGGLRPRCSPGEGLFHRRGLVPPVFYVSSTIEFLAVFLFTCRLYGVGFSLQRGSEAGCHPSRLPSQAPIQRQRHGEGGGSNCLYIGPYRGVRPFIGPCMSQTLKAVARPSECQRNMGHNNCNGRLF